jgi:hypothetical protein
VGVRSVFARVGYYSWKDSAAEKRMTNAEIQLETLIIQTVKPRHNSKIRAEE